jgi:hypothetical protein
MAVAQYRYSKSSFQSSVLAALGLTAITTFLVWLFCRLFGLVHGNTITVISGLIFFGFCSAAMVWRYLRSDIVLAFRPDGFFDSRYSRTAIPWEQIKDIRLGRVENEFLLSVYLWPRDQRATSSDPAFVVELAPLDSGVDKILEALSAHAPISLPQA